LRKNKYLLNDDRDRVMNSVDSPSVYS